MYFQFFVCIIKKKDVDVLKFKKTEKNRLAAEDRRVTSDSEYFTS